MPVVDGAAGASVVDHNFVVLLAPHRASYGFHDYAWSLVAAVEDDAGVEVAGGGDLLEEDQGDADDPASVEEVDVVEVVR